MKIIGKIVRDFLIALFTVLIFFYAFDAHAGRAIDVMCNVIDYIGGIGGLVITLIIIGASLLAIFGRMPWPALFSLGMFSAVFFGASAIVKKVTEKEVCCPKGQFCIKESALLLFLDTIAYYRIHGGNVLLGIYNLKNIEYKSLDKLAAMLGAAVFWLHNKKMLLLSYFGNKNGAFMRKT